MERYATQERGAGAGQTRLRCSRSSRPPRYASRRRSVGSTPRCAGKIWRPRRDSNPRPKVSSHFGFRRRQRRSWSGLSLHHRSKPVGAARPVSTPSPLRGLARDWHAANCEAFPDFEQIDHGVSDRNPQINRKPLLYPAELRGLYAFPLNPDASFCNAPLRAVAAFLQSGIPANSRNAASAE